VSGNSIDLYAHPSYNIFSWATHLHLFITIWRQEVDENDQAPVSSSLRLLKGFYFCLPMIIFVRPMMDAKSSLCNWYVPKLLRFL